MSRSRIRLAAVVTAGLLLAACGGTDDTTGAIAPSSASPDANEAPGDDAGSGEDATDGGMAMDDDAPMDDAMDADADDGMVMAGVSGEPADASESDRTVEVTVDNQFAFDPDDFEVATGEVVTFQITNTGDIEHEFVLGDEQAQQQMADEMGENDGHAHSGEMSNAVTIHPGEEAELTWRFPDEPTTVLVGCHVPGHYDAGMRGSITVG